MALFTLTTFVSALLLFLVQPMFAKFVLPYLGGTPAVWNTCLVFYQAALLVGYAYAHVATRWLGVRRQALLHMAVLLLPAAVLPIALPADWRPSTEHPIGEVLWVLLVCVGLPFAVVSTTAPLLQTWFAHTGERGASDPYFLYAASNLGSLGALAAYPLLVEPQWRLADQSLLWAWGYVLLAILIAGCAALVWKAPVEQRSEQPLGSDPEASPAPDLSQRLRWLALSAVASSLLQGVTTYVTTDLASTPLLWIVPLALYLLTFVVAFARRPWISREMALALQTPALLALCLALCARGSGVALSALHLFAFFWAVLACQTELAATRPPAGRLTEFYLWMSVGGLVGGVASALVAPVLFNGIYEYPLAVLAACLVRPMMAEPAKGDRTFDFLWPAAVFVMVAGTALVVRPQAPGDLWGSTATKAVYIVFLLGAAAGNLSAARPLRLTLIAAGLLVASVFTGPNEAISQERSFFGVHRVQRDPDGALLFVHGTTVHGVQSGDPDRRRTPMAYYHRRGPLGEVFAEMEPRLKRGEIAVCGLGIGGLTAYARAGQTWVFYEIDPLVEPIARRHFTYLADCPAPVEVRLGDARLSLATEPPGRFSLLIMDAFSSDSVPTHLLTLEALDLYLDKLADDGLLVFHISNRCLDLTPVVANLASQRGLAARHWRQNQSPGGDMPEHEWAASHFVVLARRPEHLRGLADRPHWSPLEPDPTRRVWTDDRSNLWEVIRWGKAVGAKAK